MRQAGSVSLLLATALVACGGQDGPTEAISPPAPATGTAAAPPPPASAPAPVDSSGPEPWGGSVRVSYACSDGSTVRVRYGHYDATVHLADGTTTTLPRAESASAGGIDAYAGGELALQREGRSIRLTRPGRSLNCQALPGSD